MAAPAVSVIIPTRNRYDLLVPTLASALAQRDVPIEVIVVDDASEDDTAAFLDGVGDGRLRVVRHSCRQGVAATRNSGLAAARGRWVAFLDDDDLWSPTKLGRQLDALRGRPGCGWCTGGAVLIGDTLEVIGAQPPPPATEDLFRVLLASNAVPGGASGVLADRQLVLDAGGFDARFSLLADWDLWIRLAQRSMLASVPAPLHAYRLHAESMSCQVGTVEEELAAMEAKYDGERRAEGVLFQRGAFEFWLADRRQRSNRRGAAAVGYLRSAGYTGPVNAAAHAVIAMAWPGAMRHYNARRARQVDGRWLREAEDWLGALPTLPPPSIATG